MQQRICRKEIIWPPPLHPHPAARLFSRLKVSLTAQNKLNALSCHVVTPHPWTWLQQSLSLAQLSNAAQCCHSSHLCRWEIMTLMSRFLRNTSGLQDLYSLGPLQGGGPQTPRLPCPPLALYHHHRSVSLETSVSFLINGCHRKRRGKTPQENSRKTGPMSCMVKQNGNVRKVEEENWIMVLHWISSD